MAGAGRAPGQAHQVAPTIYAAAGLGCTGGEIVEPVSINGELAVEGRKTRVWAARDQDNPDKMHAHAIRAEAIAKFG
jgi:hypothetical protein